MGAYHLHYSSLLFLLTIKKTIILSSLAPCVLLILFLKLFFHCYTGLCCSFGDYANFTEGESRYCAGMYFVYCVLCFIHYLFCWFIVFLIKSNVCTFICHTLCDLVFIYLKENSSMESPARRTLARQICFLWGRHFTRCARENRLARGVKTTHRSGKTCGAVFSFERNTTSSCLRTA